MILTLKKLLISIKDGRRGKPRTVGQKERQFELRYLVGEWGRTQGKIGFLYTLTLSLPDKEMKWLIKRRARTFGWVQYMFPARLINAGVRYMGRSARMSSFSGNSVSEQSRANREVLWGSEINKTDDSIISQRSALMESRVSPPPSSNRCDDTGSANYSV